MQSIDLTIESEDVSIVIQEFIKSYVRSSGCKKVVLGLSGGVDSAVSAVLCQRVLGVRNVDCLFMPDATTPPLDRRHIELLKKTFHLNCQTIDITPYVELFSTAFSQTKQISKANIKPRVRMILLYKYANDKGSLVCGASNKSELLVGYFTKYGDGGVDLQPLGDLYKTQVYQLARYLKIPEPIVKKQPTAGLWIGQTDEQELQMSYRTLDVVLAGLELKLPITEIQKKAGATKAQVERIRKRRICSHHKRRAPLIPKLGIRTPGLDWRSPVQED